MTSANAYGPQRTWVDGELRIAGASPTWSKSTREYLGIPTVDASPIIKIDDLWQPGRLLSDLPVVSRPADSGGLVHLYDLASQGGLGNAKIDCPLHGMTWVLTGPACAHDGQYVEGTTTAVVGHVRDVLSDIQGKPAVEVWRRVRVTARSFPTTRVKVLVWRGRVDKGGQGATWLLLGEGDGSTVTTRERCPLDGRDGWRRKFQAGEVK